MYYRLSQNAIKKQVKYLYDTLLKLDEYQKRLAFKGAAMSAMLVEAGVNINAGIIQEAIRNKKIFKSLCLEAGIRNGDRELKKHTSWWMEQVDGYTSTLF